MNDAGAHRAFSIHWIAHGYHEFARSTAACTSDRRCRTELIADGQGGEIRTRV
jgi:hypothetical protein